MSTIAEQRQWVADQRALGCKAAHPDDGWVDREANTVGLCYPQFNDGLGVGDVLALGWAGCDVRYVRITGRVPNRLAILPSEGRWTFEPLAEEGEEHVPLWRRFLSSFGAGRTR